VFLITLHDIKFVFDQNSILNSFPFCSVRIMELPRVFDHCGNLGGVEARRIVFNSDLLCSLASFANGSDLQDTNLVESISDRYLDLACFVFRYLKDEFSDLMVVLGQLPFSFKDLDPRPDLIISGIKEVIRFAERHLGVQRYHRIHHLA